MIIILQKCFASQVHNISFNGPDTADILLRLPCHALPKSSVERTSSLILTVTKILAHLC